MKNFKQGAFKRSVIWETDNNVEVYQIISCDIYFEVKMTPKQKENTENKNQITLGDIDEFHESELKP
jgi:hypothetical protein